MHRTTCLVSILAVMLVGSRVFVSVSPTTTQESTPARRGYHSKSSDLALRLRPLALSWPR